MPTDDAQSDTNNQSSKKTPPQSEPQGDAPSIDAAVKPEAQLTTDGAKPLAPPPRPQAQQADTATDLFGPSASAASLNLEPNPFEQSFGGNGSTANNNNNNTNAPETPGGTKLPSVAALTSPSSLLPGSGVTPFNWGGGSLRTGPLSPAMLSGPANDYFSDSHGLRGGFPTPNESSLRSGLTPGGSGSMFPAPSPNSQAIFAQLASGGATPSTIDFHRTALNAAAAQRDQQSQNQQNNATLQSADHTNGNATIKTEAKPTGPFDNHDNDAANGLFLLAQGRNGASRPGGYAAANAPAVQAQGGIKQSSTSPQMKNQSGSASARAGSDGSEDGDQSRPNTRNRGKRTSTATSVNGRRKAEDAPAKAPPAKKAKNAAALAPPDDMDMDDEDDEDDGMRTNPDGTKTKMTEEEKRKNFLERNRVAALKCRQRKKQWLANLQSKVELFSSENDALSNQISQLREEVVNLKTILLAHKDCPVTQQQGLQGAYLQDMPPNYQNQMNPYGMAGPPMAGHQIMAGQGGARRYS